jgi:hypothetical protein
MAKASSWFYSITQLHPTMSPWTVHNPLLEQQINRQGHLYNPAQLEEVPRR